MTNVQTGGLNVSLRFCNKLNSESISALYGTQEPLLTIYPANSPDKYIVNAVCFVPSELETLNPSTLPAGIFLNDQQNLFLSYNGIRQINTTKPQVPARDFGLLYDSTVDIPENMDAYHLQFEYGFDIPESQQADVLLFRQINEDPEHDRGTVGTIRKDGNG